MKMRVINAWVATIIFFAVIWIILLVCFPLYAKEIKIVVLSVVVIGATSYFGFLAGKNHINPKLFLLKAGGVGVVIILATCIFIEAFLPLIESQKGLESHFVAIEIVLVLIVGYFVIHAVVIHIEQAEAIDKMDATLNNLIKSVGILEIIESSEDYYKKLIGTIESAQDSVCMTYLTKYPPKNLGSKPQLYWQWFQDYAKYRSRDVVIKRIASLDNDEKCDWIKCKTAELAEKENYAIRVYEPADDFPPIMGVEIIDRKKVFLLGPHATTPRWIYIENRDFAEGIARYFDELWLMLENREIKALGEKILSNGITTAEEIISERIVGPSSMPKNNISVDSLILENDRRGISKLKPFLPLNSCSKSAISMLNNSGVAFIVTGFYIVNANAPETDGPPGAIAIAKALNYLGYKVYFVTDKTTFALMQHLSDHKDSVIDFPIMDDSESLIFASELTARYNPSVIIAIERCGRTAEFSYLNMNGIDISNNNAKTDYLFYNHPNTIGICDGGNEIGMGDYAEIISKIDGLPKKPSATGTTHTIIASVSNWGCYGLVAELSVLIKHNLLLSVEEEKQLIIQAVKFGAVDGVSKERAYKVDGFDLDENSKVLSELHRYIIKAA